MEAAFVAAALSLGVAIPSSPGYVGTYQWLGVASLGLLDVPVNEALAFTILMQASWYVRRRLPAGHSCPVGIPRNSSAPECMRAPGWSPSDPWGLTPCQVDWSDGRPTEADTLLS